MKRLTGEIIEQLRMCIGTFLPGPIELDAMREAANRLAELEAERGEVGSHLRYLANEARQAGDMQLILMNDEGVGPYMGMTLADALELVAIQLTGIRTDLR